MTVLTVGKESLKTVYSTALSTTVGKAVPRALSCSLATVLFAFFSFPFFHLHFLFFCLVHPEPTFSPSPLYFLPPSCYGGCGEAVGKAREQLFFRIPSAFPLH